MKRGRERRGNQREKGKNGKGGEGKYSQYEFLTLSLFNFISVSPFCLFLQLLNSLSSSFHFLSPSFPRRRHRRHHPTTAQQPTSTTLTPLYSLYRRSTGTPLAPRSTSGPCGVPGGTGKDTRKEKHEEMR